MFELNLSRDEIEEIKAYDLKQFPFGANIFSRRKDYKNKIQKAKMRFAKELVLHSFLPAICFFLTYHIALFYNLVLVSNLKIVLWVVLLLIFFLLGVYLCYKAIIGLLKDYKNEIKIFKNALIIWKYDIVNRTKYGEKA